MELSRALILILYTLSHKIVTLSCSVDQTSARPAPPLPPPPISPIPVSYSLYKHPQYSMLFINGTQLGSLGENRGTSSIPGTPFHPTNPTVPYNSYPPPYTPNSDHGQISLLNPLTHPSTCNTVIGYSCQISLL
jgi:hypothetical protein